jgi:hypothetical protein
MATLDGIMLLGAIEAAAVDACDSPRELHTLWLKVVFELVQRARGHRKALDPAMRRVNTHPGWVSWHTILGALDEEQREARLDYASIPDEWKTCYAFTRGICLHNLFSDAPSRSMSRRVVCTSIQRSPSKRKVP